MIISVWTHWVRILLNDSGGDITKKLEIWVWIQSWMRDIELGVVGVYEIEHSLMYWECSRSEKDARWACHPGDICLYSGEKMRNHSRRLRRSGQSCRKKSQETEAAWNLKETWEHSSLSHGLARVSAEELNHPKSPTLVLLLPHQHLLDLFIHRLGPSWFTLLG